jgi:tRNA G18 (ribose-2'-O)-methylase SpoU
MRGYFGIGVEGLTKPMNAGNLYRSAHAFGASFVFTLASNYDPVVRNSDTSDATGQVPFYSFDSVESMRLPDGCALVGVELADDAVDLPSFRHPRRAAYVLGSERGGLSPRLIECCDHIVGIPTRFALNLASAGAIVMYDRMLSMSRFGARPVVPGGPVEPLPEHKFGDPVIRRRRRRGASAAAGPSEDQDRTL